MKPLRLINLLAALLLFPILFTPTFAAAGEDLQEITIRVVEADRCIPQTARLSALTTAGASESRLVWLDSDRYFLAYKLDRIWLGAKGMQAMDDSQLLQSLKLSRIRYWEAEEQRYKRWNRGKGCI